MIPLRRHEQRRRVDDPARELERQTGEVVEHHQLVVALIRRMGTRNRPAFGRVPL